MRFTNSIGIMGNAHIQHLGRVLLRDFFMSKPKEIACLELSLLRAQR